MGLLKSTPCRPSTWAGASFSFFLNILMSFKYTRRCYSITKGTLLNCLFSDEYSECNRRRTDTAASSPRTVSVSAHSSSLGTDLHFGNATYLEKYIYVNSFSKARHFQKKVTGFYKDFSTKKNTTCHLPLFMTSKIYHCSVLHIYNLPPCIIQWIKDLHCVQL